MSPGPLVPVKVTPTKALLVKNKMIQKVKVHRISEYEEDAKQTAEEKFV